MNDNLPETTHGAQTPVGTQEPIPTIQANRPSLTGPRPPRPNPL